MRQGEGHLWLCRPRLLLPHFLFSWTSLQYFPLLPSLGIVYPAAVFCFLWALSSFFLALSLFCLSLFSTPTALLWDQDFLSHLLIHFRSWDFQQPAFLCPLARVNGLWSSALSKCLKFSTLLFLVILSWYTIMRKGTAQTNKWRVQPMCAGSASHTRTETPFMGSKVAPPRMGHSGRKTILSPDIARGRITGGGAGAPYFLYRKVWLLTFS